MRYFSIGLQLIYFWEIFTKSADFEKNLVGDFLSPEHRSTISSSTIVFVNNFAFGPEVCIIQLSPFINQN